ncbi:unnamed protein product [Penicillium manginii]
MYDLNLPTQFGQATVRIALPPASLLKFPPTELPETIPAPHVSEFTWKQPFNIPNDLYTQLLDVRVPITIASVYAITVVVMNRINKSRGYKAWGFSNTPLFKLFVILHNVFLAVYSAWTFAGMFQAFGHSWADRDQPNGLAGVVDSLCKINGPRGYGNAATYSRITDQWSIPNPAYQLTGGQPDPSDVGRLWNGGLAYLGWIFYLSKFYEVIDTAIILAKGKKSSTLQTYHHAGAMMCMWAGVIKRSLTTMQITQFVLGTNMAAAYLFVHYTIPYPAGSAALSHLSEAAPAAAATAVEAGVLPYLKKLAFRAAGAEGIAENVGGAVPAPQTGYTQQMVTCMDTTGQAFAIWLNVSYLLPLTYLFARFFVRSYLNRKPSKQPTHMEAAEKAGMDALKSLSREIKRAAIEGENSEVTTDDEVVRAQVQKITEVISVAQDSPIRTRASAANKVKAAAPATTSQSTSDEGFSTVPAKKGAKKQAKTEQTSSNISETKGQNPFGVLDRGA